MTFLGERWNKLWTLTYHPSPLNGDLHTQQLQSNSITHLEWYRCQPGEYKSNIHSFYNIIFTLTSTEGVDVLIELEPHYSPVVVNDVGLTIPGARYHLLSAVSLEANTHPPHDSQNKWTWCWNYLVINQSLFLFDESLKSNTRKKSV